MPILGVWNGFSLIFDLAKAKVQQVLVYFLIAVSYIITSAFFHIVRIKVNIAASIEITIQWDFICTYIDSASHFVTPNFPGIKVVLIFQRYIFCYLFHFFQRKVSSNHNKRVMVCPKHLNNIILRYNYGFMIVDSNILNLGIF